jgi:SPW repeat
MATPLNRRPEPADESPQLVSVGPANVADVIAGLVVAAAAAIALASPRGFPGLQFASLLLGVWVIVSSFILDAKFAVATPMYWSNSFSGAVLVLLAVTGLATLRRAAR